MKKEIKIENGKLIYNSVVLENIAKKYGTPLRITFLDVIKEHVETLKKSCDKVIKELNYQGKFIYANANKANYEVMEIETSVNASDAIETSSYYDLLLSKDVLLKINQKKKYIISNGFKDDNYRKEIVETNNEGFNIIAIIDSVDEYEFYKNSVLKKPLEIGLRIHLESLYYEEGDVIRNDRFGLMKDEYDYIVSDIANQNNLVLSTIHFHQRGFEFEEEKFLRHLTNAFEHFYIPASQKYSSVVNFNIGGGTPLKVDSDVDYTVWARLLFSKIQELSRKYHIACPNIISENGKYSQKDAVVNIYEVVGIKNTDKIPWFLINGSLLIAMPEKYALGEDILVTPINHLNNEMINARLSSITCDCDDVYYDKSLGYLSLPKVEKNERLYIGIIGTGSYQNSMAGKGGFHHCLLPEETDLVVFTKNNKVNYKIRSSLQSIKDIKKLTHFSFKI